ncbi:acetate/propionate family kinase [Hydrocarboniphaga sp.]|uniref:acetate/propionate family kinase n=1 Tax=Hydrocarboniphaga sp. TaxID=2033016 RepID=UPI003D121B2E
MNVLALNCGSSSLKFGLYQVGDQSVECLCEEDWETSGADAQISGAHDLLQKVEEKIRPLSGGAAVDAVGHRLVHGGPALGRHCRIERADLPRLTAAVPFAPLHLPAALAIVGAAMEQFSSQPHVACFDTTFHWSLPALAQTLPLPETLRSQGIRRYGFHGLSCESIVHQLGADLPRDLIVAHLGNGASVTAVQHGKSIDTSMGMTPAGGMPMSSRSGDIDPGVLVYLMREMSYDADRLESLINHESGLKGISGLSGDLRALHRAADASPSARLALDCFAAAVAKQIAAMITSLGGLDAIAFTGGIGQHDAAMRAAIIRRLAWLGIFIDDTRNVSALSDVQRGDSRCRILVMESREDEQIARIAGSMTGA